MFFSSNIKQLCPPVRHLRCCITTQSTEHWLCQRWLWPEAFTFCPSASNPFPPSSFYPDLHCSTLGESLTGSAVPLTAQGKTHFPPYWPLSSILQLRDVPKKFSWFWVDSWYRCSNSRAACALRAGNLASAGICPLPTHHLSLQHMRRL